MTESISTAEGGLATTLRAAQYLRMSTDPQKYSIENQAAAIAAYAALRNISIVRTYADRPTKFWPVPRPPLRVRLTCGAATAWADPFAIDLKSACALP